MIRRRLRRNAACLLAANGTCWKLPAAMSLSKQRCGPAEIRSGSGLSSPLHGLITTLLSRRSARQLGITAVGLRASWWSMPAAAAVSWVMLAGAWFFGTLHALNRAQTPPWHALLYAVWTLLQEFLVQSFIFVRLEAVLQNRRSAVFLTVILFSAAHLPNPVLVPATFAIGLALTAAFLRYRTIYPLAVAHAISGLALAVSLPNGVTHSMRVGAAYFLS